MRSIGEAGGGESLPPIPGIGPVSYESPRSSEADIGAGLSGDLREVWKPLLGQKIRVTWERCPLPSVH
jgi:hypothetical protein